MKKGLSSVFQFLLCTFICFFAFSGMAFSQQFSAQIKIQQPEKTYYYDYFMKDHLYRLESDEGGERIVIITDWKKDYIIALHPQKKFYMELSKEEAVIINPIIGWELVLEGSERKKTGTEVIAGFECDKFIYTNPGMKEPSAETWYSPELNQIIKQIVYLPGESGKGVFELINIQLALQDDAKFKIPDDYQKRPSPAEQTSAKKSQLPSLVDTEKGEAPIGRIIGSGGIVRIHVDPSLSSAILLENKNDGDSSVTITPYREGQPLTDKIIKKTLGKKGKSESSLSHGLKVDEIEIAAEEGLVRTKVLQEYSDFDKIKRQQAFIFQETGQGLSVYDNRLIHLTMTGDNQSADYSTIYISFFKGQYNDLKERVQLGLQNGESKQWEFQPGEIQSIDIVIKESGGVKVLLEQFPFEAKKELSKAEIKQLVQDVMQNNTDAVKSMLDSGVDVNLIVFSMDSLLMTACASGSPEMVTLLLGYSPDVHYKDLYGNNALTRAVWNFGHYQKMVPSLLQAGADPNSKVGSSGQINSTALGKITSQALVTKKEEDYRIIELFLEKGAYVNQTAKTGTTPLMQAAYKGNLELVELFLKYGADLKLKDKTGKTALDMAKERGHQNIISLLSK